MAPMARYREYQPGPSPWGPALILGVIFMIAFMPYMRGPDPTIAYQAARKAPNFPLPLLWIPVLIFLAVQFFGGYRDYRYDQFGRPLPRAGMYPGGPYSASGRYGNGMYTDRGLGVGPGVGPGMYGGGAYGRERLAPQRSWPWSSFTGWDSYNRYNVNNNQSWLWTSFMEYGGHWILIVLGIALFAFVGSSSVQAAPGYASRTPLSFPWSLFAPRPQIVIPLM